MNRPDRLTAITIATLKVVIVAYFLALPISALRNADLHEAFAKPLIGQGCNCRVFHWSDVNHYGPGGRSLTHPM
jgi:hypothetical protein